MCDSQHSPFKCVPDKDVKDFVGTGLCCVCVAFVLRLCCVVLRDLFLGHTRKSQ